MDMGTGVPRVRAVVLHAGPTVIDGTVIPAILFWSLLHAVGITAAVWAVLGWSAFAAGRRLCRGRRVPGVVLLGAVAVVGRAVTMLATGSTFLFFLQPVIGTVLTGLLFLGSVPMGRPLTERLAADFVPLDAEVLGRAPVRRLLLRLSLLWAAVHFANAGLTLFLLQRESVSTFVLLRPVVSLSTTGLGVVVTIVAARAVLRAGRAVAGAPAAPAPALAPVLAVAAA
jgi:intracellular septation protein A